MKKYNVAVVGATGLVGGVILSVLQERNFPVKNLKLLASGRSKGKEIIWNKKRYIVEETTDKSFKGIDIALFASAEAASGIFGWEAVKQGAVVIDNSSTFRMDERVPLIVPEVNPHSIEKHKGLIANPNCSTIQMVVVLSPIHNIAKIKRIVVSTYQSVSGWGKEAIEQLLDETKDIIGKLKKDKIFNSSFLCSDKINKVLPHQIAFNVIPQIDKFDDASGYTKEELKIVNETRKIMEDNTIKISATTVRVPVLIGHSEAVNIQTEKKITPDEIREILKRSPGIVVVDTPQDKLYPLPVLCAGKDETFVGRIREDRSAKNCIDMWIVADNLRKGAATNAVQIAELLISKKLI